jgi:hypothetical protein
MVPSTTRSMPRFDIPTVFDQVRSAEYEFERVRKEPCGINKVLNVVALWVRPMHVVVSAVDRSVKHGN